MLIFPGVEVTAQIYESANSLVYRALQQPGDRPVILKVLKENYPTPQELARYRTEYKITQSLNLTGCIKAYDLQPYQNTLVMFVEDFGGESLKIWMQQKKLTIKEFLEIAIATAENLGQIHTANIIHKDINPSNIVFNPITEQLKVIDFGISTQFTRENTTLKNPNILEGTLAYMSPEQTGRMNRSLDYRTDFYSLGVTFYELLTGKLPFPTTDALELVHCHIAKQPVPPHEVDSEVPKAVSNIVMKLLAKTAEERYQSAWGIQTDLVCCLMQLEATGEIEEIVPGENDLSERFQISQKLYGREREIESLLNAFDRVSTRSELMLISGYSGIGKSALVQEVYKPLTEKRGYFISGKFDQYQRNIPYSAIVNALQELVKQLLTESEAELKEWQKQLREALGINGPVILDVIPELELIIGQQNSVLELDATASQNRFNLVFQNFIKVFTKRDRPLVIFLDDLQWADGASLQLMKMLMSYSSAGLFLIGAYRDNEVSAAHPLMLTLDEIAKNGTVINQILLSPLNLASVTQLISEALKCPGRSAKPLAELVLLKTGGNPFFLHEFLKSLYAEKMFYFDAESLTWRWELNKIKARGFTDNVVELLANKIKELPKNTQKMLKIAACIGNQFELEMLALICKNSVENTVNDLYAAIEENLIVLLGNMGDVELAIAGKLLDSQSLEYKFIHDRIQQAAYSLIPDWEKPLVHQQIGQLLLQNTPDDKREEKIFDIVNQLNFGIQLISNQPPRDELAQLNLTAAQKAKAAIAFNAAREYLNTGIKLLANDSWQSQYELTLALYQEAAAVTYLCGDFEQMETWTNVVIQNSKTILNKIKVYELKIQACMSQQKFLDNVKIGLKVLELLGVSFPSSPTPSYIQQRLQETWENLKSINIEHLIDLPAMTNPHKLAVMRILSTINSPISMVAPELWPLIVCEQMNLLIKYGNSPESALVYNCYGTLLNKVFQDFGAAYEFGALALKLVECLKIQEFKSNVLLGVAITLIHLKSHLRESLLLLEESYSIAIQNGDISYTVAAAFFKFQHSYFSGLELTKIELEIGIYSNTIAEYQPKISLNYYEFFRQIIFSLIDSDSIKNNFVDKFICESQLISSQIVYSKIDIFIVYLNQSILSYFFEKLTKSVKNAIAAEKYLDEIPGMIYIPLFFLYDSLVQLAVYSSTDQSEQENLLLKVNKNQESLQKWAESAPMNFKHKYDLVEAEKARICGQFMEAMDYYDRAIQGAKENEYINEAALAYELAAKFYLSIGKELIAKAYMQEARYCYQLWGAAAKVKDLETRYPQLLAIAQPTTKEISTATSTTGRRPSSSLDIATVMKASEAISGEIMLDKLLSKLMKILIENVGAQKGYLILENQGQLLIEAEGTVEDEQITVLQSTPVKNCQKLSESIVSYVARTQENVVLNNATIEGQFTNDPYIKSHQSKSILCAALMNQGQLTAIIYLENRLTASVFTSDRLEVLQLLSGQAAIAIANAKLYAQVKERESRLTQVIDAMPIGVTVHDTTGQITYANQTARLLSSADIVEANSQQLAETYQLFKAGTNQLYPTAQMPIVRSLAGETVKIEDMEFHLPDKIIPLEVSSTPIIDETGKINYAIATFQDISDRKQAEKLLADYNRTLEQQVADRTLELHREILERKRAELAAQAANQAKSTFLANMSHELRTPLNAILGFSHLMNRAAKLSPEYQEHLGIITRSGEHLLTLINQVLDLSKIEAERATLNETNFDLHRLLGDIEDMFQLQAESKGLQLLVERSPDVPQYVRTDEVKLRQVLLNLLSNAIKFTSEGGIFVRIKAENSLNKIDFEIEDTGEGIAGNELETLFEAFVQTKTGKKSQQGTGLGLAIARSFVQLMGGQMSVMSQIKQGTIFKFDIIIHAVDSADSLGETLPRRIIALEPNQPHYRILIADDRWDNRQLLVQLLSPLGFELYEAKNGIEAIEIWQQYSPHLIFMDMRMPMMDGYEATQRIKATTKGQATAIVAVTASSFEEEKAVVLSTGCDEFIRKPFREESIFDALHKHIGVQFIFEEIKAAPVLMETEGNVLTKDALAALPFELVANLQEAISNLDLEQMQTLIDRIGEMNPPLASAIAAYVKKFQYEALLDLISPLRDKL